MGVTTASDALALSYKDALLLEENTGLPIETIGIIRKAEEDIESTIKLISDRTGFTISARGTYNIKTITFEVESKKSYRFTMVYKRCQRSVTYR